MNPFAALEREFAKQLRDTPAPDDPWQTDHSQCKVSTGVCGNLTAGTGELSEFGYWEHPCHACAALANLAEIDASLQRMAADAPPYDGNDRRGK